MTRLPFTAASVAHLDELAEMPPEETQEMTAEQRAEADEMALERALERQEATF